MGIGDWGLGPIPNPQSPIPNSLYCLISSSPTDEHSIRLSILAVELQ